MSRNIKTVECLKKHEGKTVKVIADNGSVFEATVELDSQGDPVLYTTSEIAKGAGYWWHSRSHGGYGHYCAKDFQITKELKSLTLLPSRKKKATKYLTMKELKEGVGHFCKMSDGSVGFIVWSNVCPRVLLHQEQDGCGWVYDAASEPDDDATAPVSFRKQFKYAWNVGHKVDAETIKVVEILDAREESVDESPNECFHKKTLLDMTIREVLEKLDEIIKR